MSKICYSPSSRVRPHYGACDPRANSISLCCGIGDICLTNGLCRTRSGMYYSGGCTDSTYEAAICPNFCILGEHPAMYMAISLLTCVIGYAHRVVECPLGAAVKAGDFCCPHSAVNNTASCCDTARNGLGLGAAVYSGHALSPVTAKEGGDPASTRSGATDTSSRSITGWNPFFRAGPRLACMLTICRFFYAHMGSQVQ